MPQNPLSRSRGSVRPYFVLNLLTRHLKAHLYAATIRHALHQPPRSPRRFARTRTPNESPGLAAAVRCRIPRRASTFAARSRPGSVSFRFFVGYKLRLLRAMYINFLGKSASRRWRVPRPLLSISRGTTSAARPGRLRNVCGAFVPPRTCGSRAA